MATKRDLKFETKQIHVGQENPDPTTGARAVPIYQTTSYVFDNSDHAEARFNFSNAGNIYGRLPNPSQDVFEQCIEYVRDVCSTLVVSSGPASIRVTPQY